MKLAELSGWVVKSNATSTHVKWSDLRPPSKEKREQVLSRLTQFLEEQKSPIPELKVTVRNAYQEEGSPVKLGSREDSTNVELQGLKLELKDVKAQLRASQQAQKTQVARMPEEQGMKDEISRMRTKLREAQTLAEHQEAELSTLRILGGEDEDGVGKLVQQVSLLKHQLESAGIKAIDEIVSLVEAKAKLREALEKVMEGDEEATNDLDKVSKRE